MNIASTLSSTQVATYLRTLPAIRERCSRVFDLATQKKLQYFDYHPENEAKIASYCINIITVGFTSYCNITQRVECC